MNSVFRVMRSEGWQSALCRTRERMLEAWRLQRKFAEGWVSSDRRAPLLNVIGMPPAARLGGLPIQLRARLAEEQAQRRVALHYRNVLEVGMRAWRVHDIEQALKFTGARTLHLEGTFGLPLAALLKLPVDIILSLHDLALLTEPDAVREALLKRARLTIFPSEYLRSRYRIDGPIIEPGSPAVATKQASGIRHRIAFVGSFKRQKGAHLLPAIINTARANHPNIEWHIFGGGEVDLLHAIRQLPGVSVHGYYTATALPCLLAQHHIGLALLPSIEPESFGLTLSECWSAGVPAITFAHGAQAERIGRFGGGWLVPLEADAAGISELLSRWLRGEINATVPATIATPLQAARAHLEIYRGLGFEVSN
jgi:Glycosyl transferases group 1